MPYCLVSWKYLSALGKSEAEAAAVLLALNDAALAMKEGQANG